MFYGIHKYRLHSKLSKLTSSLFLDNSLICLFQYLYFFEHVNENNTIRILCVKQHHALMVPKLYYATQLSGSVQRPADSAATTAR